MNWREQNLNLMSSLLHHISRNVQDPEAFKVVFGVFWKDMVHAAGDRNGVPWESEVYFTFALCRNDEVLAAAQPRTFSEQGTMLRLHSWRQDVLRDMGVPLFSDLLTKKKEADGTIKLELKSMDCPPPSGWRLPMICVPPALNELLAAKGMVEDDGFSECPAFVPTEYGNTLGLCETRWFKRSFGGDTEATSALYAFAAGWVDRVRMGERPWGGEPDWTCLPLEVRLERMRDGHAGNPGHCNTDIGTSCPADALCHFFCRLFTDRTISLQGFFPDPKPLLLGFIGISHKAFFQHIRSSGHIHQSCRNQSSGNRLR